jgi:hypothetical protein
MMISMKKTAAFAIATISLVGCASVPMGDKHQDAALKTFTAPAAKAGIYIYRNESIGSMMKMDVGLDGRPVGQTVANTFLYIEVTPGKHMVTSTAENIDTVEVNARPGSLNYVWQEVKRGIMFRTKLHVVSETIGQQGVRETKLALTNKTLN